MPLRSNLISAANNPRVFGRAVFLQLFEELFEARVELPNRADAVEAQRQIARRGHGLVYPSEAPKTNPGSRLWVGTRGNARLRRGSGRPGPFLRETMRVATSFPDDEPIRKQAECFLAGRGGRLAGNPRTAVAARGVGYWRSDSHVWCSRAVALSLPAEDRRPQPGVLQLVRAFLCRPADLPPELFAHSGPGF